MKKITRRRFLLGAGGALLVAGGLTGYWASRQIRRPIPIYSGPVSTLAAIRESEPFDVCIIGSGPAGTVLGTDLARAGLRTLILESGGNMGDVYTDSRYQGLETFVSSGSIAYPVATSRVRALGGTSNIWTGRCSRLHVGDFERNAYTPDGQGWPLSYWDVEPYYARAEETLRVRGSSLSDFHAPRSGPLPLEAKRDIAGLKALMEGIGVTVDVSPTSSARNDPGPVRVAVDLLPDYARLPGASLVQGVTVTRLIADATGRITAAEVKDLDRTPMMVRARAYVVACGGIASAHLLAASRSGERPNGLGNEHDQVGRYFCEHPNIGFSGMIEHNRDTLSPQYELARCHQFYDEFKQAGVGSVLLVISQSWVYREDLKQWDVDGIKDKVQNIASRLSRAELRIGATMEMFPSSSNRVMLSADQQDYFGNPVPEVRLSYSQQDEATRTRVGQLIRDLYQRLGAADLEERDSSWSHHHLGTCRMGADPRHSVVDVNLKVHGMRNLYVAGSATFVTGGAAHPTLLITALSHRLAEHLQQRFSASEFELASDVRRRKVS